MQKGGERGSGGVSEGRGENVGLVGARGYDEDRSGRIARIRLFYCVLLSGCELTIS